MKKYLIDSVVLIDHLNGISKATNWLRRYGNTNSVISVITRAEILVGASAKNKLKITALLDTFECVEINKEIADLAAIYRKKYNLKLPDAFQTAIALKNNLTLVTRNTKDFNTKMNFVKIPYKF